MSGSLSITLDNARYQEVLRNSKKLRGLLSYDAPALATSSTAIIGRSEADAALPRVLGMGTRYFKSGKSKKKGVFAEAKVWAMRRWDLGGSWASVSYAPRGEHWLLSRYSWETKWRRGSDRPRLVTAKFTSNIANLFAHNTKPYGKKSPPFYTPARSYAQGAVRQGKPQVWPLIQSKVAGSVDDGIDRTERKLFDHFEL